LAGSIDITTTQNVTIEYELASLRERILAYLIDMFAIGISFFVLFQLAFMLFGALWENSWSIFWMVFMFFYFFMYHILFEIMNTGQSLGKLAMNIRVVRLDGKEPEWSDVVLRSVLHLIDTLFCFGTIGALFIKTTPKSQRLGDIAANTTLIKISYGGWRYRLDDILNISTLDNYTPTYPQVRTLSEKDMLFVKNLLARREQYPNQAHEEVLEDLVTHLMPLLGIPERPLNRLEFLKTLLKDYIVLTR